MEARNQGWITDEGSDTIIWHTGEYKLDRIQEADAQRGLSWVRTAGGLSVISRYFSRNREHREFVDYLEEIGKLLRASSLPDGSGRLERSLRLWGSLTTNQER